MGKLLGFALSFIPGVGPLLSSALGLVSSFGAKAVPIGEAVAAEGKSVVHELLINTALREFLLLALLVFVFLHSRGVEAGLQAKLNACLHPKAAPIAVVQAAVTQAASVKHQAADTTLQDQGRKVAQEIPTHVTPEISRAFPLPVGAVRVLDDAFGVPVPDAAGQPDDVASAVTLSAGVPVLADDINACRRNAQQLSDLQGWIRDQQAAATPDQTAPVTDEVDRAQAVEELALRGSIARARGEQLAGDAVGPNCIGCGEPIDEDRRRANPKAARCLECQQGVEMLRRMFMRKLL